MGPGVERWFSPLSLNFLESPLTTAKSSYLIRDFFPFLRWGGVGGMSQLFAALVVLS